MRIYVVVTPFFPTGDSFRGAFIYDQVCAISRTGKYDKVVILRPKQLWSKCKDYQYEGWDVHYFPILQMPSNLLIGVPDKLNRMLFLRTLKKIGVNPSQVAVVHAHVSLNSCYVLALKALNPFVKTVLQHHDADPYGINMSKLLAGWGWNTYINAKYLMKIYEQIDLHVSVSEKVEHNLLAFPEAGKEEVYSRYMQLLKPVRMLKQACLKKCYVLYNGVDTRFFYKKDMEKAGTKFRIGSIGNFTEIKDQMTLLRSVKRLVDDERADIEVILIGSGPLLKRCMEYVGEYELETYVTFRTEVSHTALLDFYNSLDLFVLPSYFEGFGCVFTEAYACGVPFITCYKQGVSEWVEEPEHWLIEAGDDKKLSELIHNYMKNRPRQCLNHSYAIDDLMPPFLGFLDNEV